MTVVLRRWLRTHPLTLAVVVLLGVVWVLTAAPGTGPALAPEHAGLDPEAIGQRHWWALGTSILVAGGAVQFAGAILAAIVGVGWAERILRWRRTLVAFLVTGLIASGIGVGAEYLGTVFHEFWASSVAHVDAVDPLTPIAGAVAWATSAAPQPWSRRVRVLLVATASALLLYSGQPADLYLLLAVLIGILGGRLTIGPRAGSRASAHETRALLALTTVIFAVGPLLTLLSATRYGLLSPLGIAVTDIAPAHPGHAIGCVAGHVAHGCVGELTRTPLRGIGSTLVSLLPLGLMLVAARGLVAGRRVAVWVLALFGVVESAIAAFYFGVLPLSGSRWFTPLAPERYWELSLWIVVSTLVPLAFGVVLILHRRMFPVLPSRRRLAAYLVALALGIVVPAAVFVAGAAAVPRQFVPHATLGRILDDLLDRFVPASFLRHERPDLRPVGPVAHLLYAAIGPMFWITVVLATLVVLRGARGLALEAPEADRIRALLRRGSGSLGFMATWAGNRLWTSDDGTAGISYRVVAGHAVTLSDPFGAIPDRARVAAEFLDFCDRMAWVPVFYSVHDDWRQTLAERGWRSLPVAEEAVIDPETFTVAGKRMQDVRTSVNRAARLGLTVRWGTWSSMPLRITAQVGALSEQWMAEKELPELGFTLGGLDELRDDDVLVGIALDEDQRVLAVTSWLPMWTDGALTGWTLDFMRRAPESPNGVMEYLLAGAVERFRDEGIHAVSLSGSPLADTAEEARVPVLSGVLALIGRALEPLYGFRSLLRFKRKFGAEERTLHLCYADPLALPGIGLAVAGCYLPGFELRRLPAVLRRTR